MLTHRRRCVGTLARMLARVLERRVLIALWRVGMGDFTAPSLANPPLRCPSVMKRRAEGTRLLGPAGCLPGPRLARRTVESAPGAST